ncbi:MAG: hypothetical protein AAFN48_07890 [Pseudomonadota bacterium]
MQRLVLAILVLAALVVVLAVVLAGLRAVMAPKQGGEARTDDGIQKVAFMLLAGLMVYVAAVGAE